MMLVVITRKKWLNSVLLTLISFLFLFILFQMFRFLLPQTEITFEQRVSFWFPSSASMSSIYMTSPDLPAVQADSLIGRKWETQKIEQLDLSEIQFRYPQTLRLDEIRTLGSEITIHLNYQHNNNKMFGFFQVWKMKQPLKDFLSLSKKYSSMTFESFHETSFKVQQLDGVMWEYVFLTKMRDVHGLEAFIENGDEMYRFTMYIDEENYKPTYKKMLQKMVQSLRVKGKADSAE
ncbi:MAG: hypothetical protein GX115_05950 [Ruminiclostridium sp.]|nr:hypothetical protein [Ruminiclostridium sp.]